MRSTESLLGLIWNSIWILERAAGCFERRRENFIVGGGGDNGWQLGGGWGG